MPGSHTCAITSKLLVPYLELFPGYMQSVPKMVTTICGKTQLAPAHPVCRPTLHGAGAWPSCLFSLCPCHHRWSLNRSYLRVLGSMRRICSAVINEQGGHTWYWFFVTSIVASQLSATSENTKNSFYNFKFGQPFAGLHELSFTVHSSELLAMVEKIKLFLPRTVSFVEECMCPDMTDLLLCLEYVGEIWRRHRSWCPSPFRHESSTSMLSTSWNTRGLVVVVWSFSGVFPV